MPVRKLDKIFNPQRIAVIGVTPNPQSVGGKVLTNLVGSGFRGVVYPVNAQSEAVLGIQCYRNIKLLPHVPDLAIVCAPAPEVPGIVRDCGESGIDGLIVISAGFREIGDEGSALEEQLREEFKKYHGMRLIGPNCLGIIVPGLRLNASFANGMPQDGHIAFISQSGALCSSVLDWALEEKIGFSNFVSIGNTLDVDFADLIDFFGEDEKTRSIILYVESINEARKFMTAARAFARTKPIIAYKAGRFPESAEVAASHTGALAAEDEVYDAAFQRAGIGRVLDIGEIFDYVDLIGRKKIPKGSRLAIITNAGGPGVIATDALIAANGVLAKISQTTVSELNECLPPYWSHRNPVDVLGDARSKRIAKAVEIVIKDNGVDAILVIITPQAMTNPTSIAKAIGKLSTTTSKPILAAWLGGKSMREGIQILNDAGVASYMTPEQAVHAFMTLVDYSRNLETIYETPRDVPLQFTLDRDKLRAEFETSIARKGPVLTEDVSKSILEAYGIPVAQAVPAPSAEQAVEIAERIGYPVVLKILSPEIIHKSDVDGVALNLQNQDMVFGAFHRIVKNAKHAVPGANVQGTTVQKMIIEKDAHELIIGFKKNKIFGTIIMIGLGGTTVELFRDRALGFPPLNERLARRMLESLKVYPLLKGYRGRPGINIDRLIELMIRLSYLAADYPEIKELDINPLLVGATGIVALDARALIDEELRGIEVKPYAHLALRPYPEEFVKNVTLKDGTPLVLRPIKPEDEPMWFELLRSCSRESLYQRFRYVFHWETHEVASHYCFIDYDREMAIVAEYSEDGNKKLLGVGRMVADPDHVTAEYAILVADAWQNRRVGALLTDYCFDVARKWGVKRIVAQTTSDNPRMVSIFEKRGFEIIPDESGSVINVAKDI
jgi:acetyltransferase